jgi:ribosomal 30S subunit maturation factor RimM
MESAYYLDLIESKIIAENKPINEAKNLYNYMSYIIENDLIPLKNGEFYPDLDDYLVGDIGEYDLADGLEVIEGGM